MNRMKTKLAKCGLFLLKFWSVKCLQLLKVYWFHLTWGENSQILQHNTQVQKQKSRPLSVVEMLSIILERGFDYAQPDKATYPKVLPVLITLTPLNLVVALP